jgi:Ser/Thr protein kinase RdoA (MazF antagonist)
VQHDSPPAGILRGAGLKVLPGEIRPREGRAWLVDWQGTRGVLRRLPGPATADPPPGLTDDVRWLHAVLAQVAELGFAAPWPLPAFDGRSWTTRCGMVWELVSFLPGEVVGWAAEPPMEEIGALLGRYHATVSNIEVPGQRPGALPLVDVPEILLSGQPEAAGVSPRRTAVIRDLARQLADSLTDAAELTGERVVIHGDFTNHNVLAAGTPPRATGVIDFALAHAETPLADIGYGLWRSGRPDQEADHLDLARIQRFVRGYASSNQLSPDAARVIPLYLRGRGLQMIAKRIRAGRPETGMLDEVQWLSANADALADAIAAALT